MWDAYAGEWTPPVDPSGPTPGIPGYFTATATSSTTISLTWLAAETATSYRIYRGTTSGVRSLAITINTGEATSVTDTGLQASTTYYYSIRALGSGGEGTQSSEVSATTTGQPSGTPVTGQRARGILPGVF